MNIRDKFNFDDFTENAYRIMLTDALDYYTFTNYIDFEGLTTPFIIKRHDVDFSVHRALALAKIENELGIKATYFFNPHCEFYNLFEREISDKIIEIKSLGHKIGLHFDSHYWGILEQKQLDEFLLIDKNLMDTVFKIDVQEFSFHNTTPFTMSCKEPYYSGLLNVYSNRFFDDINYCSDSNGFWRYERMPEIISSRKYEKIQLLTHPEWWVEKVESPWKKIQTAIIGRSNKNLDLYKNHLKRNGMKNIDWGGEI